MKRVPDSATRVKVGPGGSELDPAGVKYGVNPYDEFALEEAIRRREAAGSGTVTVISLGPAATAEALRQALAMGADEAVHLKNEGSHDGLAVARALADEISAREYDLVLFVNWAPASLPERGRFLARPQFTWQLQRKPE